MEGIIDRIEDKTAKNGKGFQAIVIDTGSEHSKVFNWGASIKQKEGDFVVVETSGPEDGKFPPRMDTMHLKEKPAEYKQSVMDDPFPDKRSETPRINPANSCVYLSMKVAADLIGFPPTNEKGEQDHKTMAGHLEMFEQAYEKVLLIFEGAGLRR